MFMRVRGGPDAEVNRAFVYAPLADFYDLSEEARRLTLADYYTDGSQPGFAWNSEVNAASKILKKDGYLTLATRSEKSAWRLTPNGVERADFWLKRMIDKAAALRALHVDPNLTRFDSEPPAL
jgi:hypothetical protein